jgi:hypothetical protein
VFSRKLLSLYKAHQNKNPIKAYKQTIKNMKACHKSSMLHKTPNSFQVWLIKQGGCLNMVFSLFFLYHQVACVQTMASIRHANCEFLK